MAQDRGQKKILRSCLLDVVKLYVNIFSLSSCYIIFEYSVPVR